MSLYSNVIWEFVESMIKNTAKNISSKSDDLLKTVRRDIINIIYKHQADGSWVKRIIERNKVIMDEVLNGYVGNGFGVLSVEARLLYKLLAGASSGLGIIPFEVGVSWDPILDSPVIPASSIKGCMRGYVELLSDGKISEEEKEVLIDYLFGSSSRGLGAFIFTDAYPVKPGDNGLLIMGDVLTPHYFSGGKPVKQELYSEKAGITDGANPNPVIHLAIPRNTHFRIIIALRKDYTLEINDGPIGPDRVVGIINKVLGRGGGAASRDPWKTLAFSALRLLSGSLETLGVGSRSLKGYGKFEIVGARLVVGRK